MMQEIRQSRGSSQPRLKQLINQTALPQVDQKCQILAKKGFLRARNVTSGVALLLYSAEVQLGILLHLDQFGTSKAPAPDAFSASALALILAEFQTLGVANSDLQTYAIGGSSVDGVPATSCVAVRRMLWNHELLLSACDLGGHQMRSIWMDVATGRTIIRSKPLPKSIQQSGDPISVAS